MPGPKPPEVELTEGQRSELKRIARRAKAEQRQVTRSKIILLASEGANNTEIARRLNTNRIKTALWRNRWLEADERLASAEAEEDPRALPEAIAGVLSDAPRSGGPPTFSAEQLCSIVALACEPPEESGLPVSHWTPETIAAEAIKRGIVESISSRHVGRFLKEGRASTPSQSILAQQ